jgi:protein gp37
VGANTKISWANHTFNPWKGCTKVSPACDNCYAEALVDRRFHAVKWGAGQPRERTTPKNWREPLKWNAEAAAKGVRYRVFCASLADVFDNEIDPQWRTDLFKLISETPELDWLLLTKRIGNVDRMLADTLTAMGCTGKMGHNNHSYLALWPWPNVWIGATICNQEEADRDIPKLLKVQAAKRFLSMEPLLGPVEFRWTPYAHQATGETYREYLDRTGRVNEFEALRKVDWVIVGGESGSNARPMHPNWVRALRNQCEQTGVAFHFKQWGEYRPATGVDEATTHPRIVSDRKAQFPDNPTARDFANFSGCFHMPHQVEAMLDRPNSAPVDCAMVRVGKEEAGRDLDGRTWNEVPA